MEGLACLTAYVVNTRIKIKEPDRITPNIVKSGTLVRPGTVLGMIAWQSLFWANGLLAHMASCELGKWQ